MGTDRDAVWWLRTLAWVGVAALVGLLFLFPDAVSRLRQLGAPYAEMPEDCSLSAGPCTAGFADGTRVTLTAEPGEAVSTEPVRFEVAVDGEAVPRTLELSGLDMNMGLVRMPLEPRGEVWETSLSMPVCTVERMQWRVDVLLDGRAAGFRMWSRR